VNVGTRDLGGREGDGVFGSDNLISVDMGPNPGQRRPACSCAIVFSCVSRSCMASLKGRSHEKYTVSIPAKSGVMRSLVVFIALSP
jgi:hypothetical protein